MSSKRRPGLYVVTWMSFLALVTWLSIRAYDSMIGQIYYGPLQGFFASAFKIRGADSPAAMTKVAVFYSKATAESFQDRDQYGALVVRWRRALGDQRFFNQVVDGKGLVGDALKSYNVLVLPLATRLSDAEIAAIRDFAAQEGHGVILSGSAGSLDENGAAREVSLAAELTGGDDFQDAPRAPDGKSYLILDGRTPLSANIPPGVRVAVNAYDRPLSARLLETRAEPAAYWADGGPREALDGGRYAILSGRYRSGRFVWAGFTLGSPVDPFGVKVGDLLARNMVAYASFSPIFGKEAWPDGKQAAVVFAQQGADPAAAALFASNQARCTFFVTAEEASADVRGIKSLAANPLFELGFRGKSDRSSLEAGKKALEALGASRVAGFSPESGAYDKAAPRALLDSGFSYVDAADASGEPPTIVEARKPHLLSIGRSLKLLMRVPPAEESGALDFEKLRKDFDAVYRVGGFYQLSLPPKALADPRQAKALAEFVDYVKRKNVWLPSLAEAADWTGRWMLVDIDAVYPSKVRSNLVVTNAGAQEINSLRLDAYLPEDTRALTARSEKMGGQISVHGRQNGRAEIEIRDLRGEGLVFFVDSSGGRAD